MVLPIDGGHVNQIIHLRSRIVFQKFGESQIVFSGNQNIQRRIGFHGGKSLVRNFQPVKRNALEFLLRNAKKFFLRKSLLFSCPVGNFRKGFLYDAGRTIAGFVIGIPLFEMRPGFRHFLVLDFFQSLPGFLCFGKTVPQIRGIDVAFVPRVTVGFLSNFFPEL